MYEKERTIRSNNSKNENKLNVQSISWRAVHEAETGSIYIFCVLYSFQKYHSFFGDESQIHVVTSLFKELVLH